MSKGVLCGQVDCKNYAFYRFTWPGKDEAAICTEHHLRLNGIANAMGLHIQTLPIDAEEHERSALRSTWTSRE